MKRVFCLYRVSTLGQVDKEKDDIPMQKQKCCDYIKQQGWEFYDEIAEKGVSGYSTEIEERAAIKEIKKAAEEKKFDILLVFMLDRLGRQDFETPVMIKWFNKRGVEVWSVEEGQQKLDSSTDRLLAFMNSWLAHNESEHTSIRTKAGLAQLVKDGHHRGGTIPYGYHLVKNGRINKRQEEVGDLEVVPSEAEIVKDVFRKYVHEGLGINRISKYLNENNILNHYGNRFSFSSIRVMIQNVLYIGILKSGDTQSEPIQRLQIIDNETFERAQEIRIDRTKEYEESKTRRIPLNTKSKALLSSIARCGHCGGKLVLTTNVKHRKRKDGSVVTTKRIRYRCYNKTRKICNCDGQTEYAMERLDGLITGVLFDLFKKLRSLPENEIIEKRYQNELASCMNKLKGARSEQKKYTDSLSNLQDEMVKAVNGESKFDSDDISDSIKKTKERLSTATTAVQQYESELENRQQCVTDILSQYREVITWADIFQNSTDETKKMIAAYLIHSVAVRRGYEATIKFNIAYEQFCMV